MHNRQTLSRALVTLIWLWNYRQMKKPPRPSLTDRIAAWFYTDPHKWQAIDRLAQKKMETDHEQPPDANPTQRTR